MVPIESKTGTVSMRAMSTFSIIAGLALTMIVGAWHPVSAQGVEVMVVDETENRPVANRAEIWVRGNGSWWLTSGLREGGGWTTKKLRTVRVGIRDTVILIYRWTRRRGDCNSLHGNSVDVP